MDKIEQYKNLNEQVNRLLTKEMATTLNEQVASAAQELVEALDDANKVTQLMRAGLVDSGRVSRVRNALKDPEKAMKNPSVRSDLINMLMSLVNIITSNPTAFSTVRKKAKEMAGASEEPVMEESEQLDELSKKTLASYIKKADADALDIADEIRKKKKEISRQGDYRDHYAKDDPHLGSNRRYLKLIKKHTNRMKGMNHAADELVKEEELSPKQKKIDLNKNKKIDGEDLAMLRKKGGMQEGSYGSKKSMK